MGGVQLNQQLTLPAKTGYGGILENDWQEVPNLPTVKTAAILLPPQPSPPVSTIPHDKYERLKRYMAARIATGYATNYVLYLSDEYARKLVGGETADQLDLAATLVEVASIELRIHTCCGGALVPPL
jgi:hypothetical protein